jgi:hypothetical protein
MIYFPEKDIPLKEQNRNGLSKAAGKNQRMYYNSIGLLLREHSSYGGYQ